MKGEFECPSFRKRKNPLNKVAYKYFKRFFSCALHLRILTNGLGVNYARLKIHIETLILWLYAPNNAIVCDEFD